MIVASTIGGPGGCPRRADGGWLVASIDVEWTKNYKVTNGNRPFCYSTVWLEIPPSAGPVDLATRSFSFTSAYAGGDDESSELVRHATEDLEAAIGAADMIVGHQLCADLGVLSAHASSRHPVAVIELARDLWRRRRTDGHRPQILDTRYDTGSMLTGRSRRLVDVCTEVGLDVTQPELAGTSMTALHRRWLETKRMSDRERITVMNLRHSLSAALVALRAVGRGTWTPTLNVNDLLDRELGGSFAWIDDPAFRALVTGGTDDDR